MEHLVGAGTVVIVQRRDIWTLGGRMVRLTAPWLLISASVAVLVCGCAPGENVMTTAAVPQDPALASAPGPVPSMAAPGQPDSSNVKATAEQRAYLLALSKAGVHPSNELMALSIGSYVCQAHVAGQSDQAVRDFVLPLVRGDLHDAHPDVAVSSMAAQVEKATTAYMRIATDELC